MRSIAFVTQKGGTGKTTLTAALAVAAAAVGEKVIALDLDSQASLVRWSERRKTANAPNNVVIEPLETERLPQLPPILDGFAAIGFTLAVCQGFDGRIASEHALELVQHVSADFERLEADARADGGEDIAGLRVRPVRVAQRQQLAQRSHGHAGDDAAPAGMNCRNVAAIGSAQQYGTAIGHAHRKNSC